MTKCDALENLASQVKYSEGFDDALSNFVEATGHKDFLKSKSSEVIETIEPGKKYALEVRVAN